MSIIKARFTTGSYNIHGRMVHYTMALDTQKAFNTVWYDSLFRKLFLEGHLDIFAVHYITLLQCNTIEVKVADLLNRAIELHQM